MKNSRIKKYLRITVISAFFLFCASALSGCGHYSRRETAEWFQQNVVDEGIFVSKEYTEREGDDGYTDRIWSAHLKELPEVEFELISNKSLSLFPYYDIETTYYLEIGRYYLDNCLESDPSALSGLEVSTDEYWHQVIISGIYDTLTELDTFCRKMEAIENYMSQQDYPCKITYRLAYREPVTYCADSADDMFSGHDTYISVDGSGSSPDSPGPEVLGNTLRNKARNAFAGYAAAYRLETDQFTEEQLDNAVSEYSDRRFTITRPDGMEICYPELLLARYDSMSFGCLYEVLVREGVYEVSGTPEEFTFTASDGSSCSFSYSYKMSEDSSGKSSDIGGCTGAYYYLSDGDKVILSDAPLIDSEQFSELTGLSFKSIDS